MGSREDSVNEQFKLNEKRDSAAEWLRQLVDEESGNGKGSMGDAEYCAKRYVSAQADYTIALMQARKVLGTL